MMRCHRHYYQSPEEDSRWDAFHEKVHYSILSGDGKVEPTSITLTPIPRRACFVSLTACLTVSGVTKRWLLYSGYALCLNVNPATIPRTVPQLENLMIQGFKTKILQKENQEEKMAIRSFHMYAPPKALLQPNGSGEPVETRWRRGEPEETLRSVTLLSHSYDSSLFHGKRKMLLRTVLRPSTKTFIPPS